MPGFSVLMRSLLVLVKNMKPDSAFLGALGSFFLRGLRAFLPSPADATQLAAQLCWQVRGAQPEHLRRLECPTQVGTAPLHWQADISLRTFLPSTADKQRQHSYAGK
jgi:hypothetical protein